MLHKHQAFFVFLDFILSVCMLVITVLALSGHFNKVVEVNSCPTSPVVAASPATPAVSAEPEASNAATTSGSIRKTIPSSK